MSHATSILLGLRDRLGIVHRRTARPGRTVTVFRRGQPIEGVEEPLLHRGDRFEHDRLGPVTVTGRVPA